MEFAAMVRSVLKLSAGIQLALRSSLGRARLPLPAGTGTHRHVHSWQASPKTCEKPRDSWMLLSRDIFKRGKTEGGEKKRKERQNTFSCVVSQGHLGQLGKSLFNMLSKTLFMCVVYHASRIYTWHKKQSKKKKGSLYTLCLSCGTVYANYIRV